MSFAADQGYLPASIPELMDLVREGVNTQFGTTYDAETFVGTNFYKFYYALIQILQASEITTGEIVLKLQQYFVQTNESIARPSTTAPGVLDALAAAGFQASVKGPLDADAGKIYVCVNVDSGASDYVTKKNRIAAILAACVPGGIITQGTESVNVTLSNAQSFAFKYALPSKTATKLRLTLTLSTNNQSTILTDDAVKALLLANVNARYSMGVNFEPQRYFSTLDAPWASVVLLEYSLDGGSTWASTVHTATYNELLTFQVSDITLITS